MQNRQLERPGPVFVSYSRKDMDHFYQLKRSPVGGLIWYDVRDIKKSDQNWRSKIDSAIKSSSGVIVLCSANSKESSAVTSEIELAQSYNKPIFPLWVAGDVWSISCPFSLISYNYTDFRDGDREKEQAQAQALKQISEDIFQSWPSHFELGKATDSNLERVFSYYYTVEYGKRRLLILKRDDDNFLKFTQTVYDVLLKTRVDPLTYGSQWCIRNNDIFFLPVSWAWAPGLPVLDFNFFNRSLLEMGMAFIGVFEVALLDRNSVSTTPIGLIVDVKSASALFFLNDIDIAQKLGHQNIAKVCRSLLPEELASIDLSDKIQVCVDPVKMKERGALDGEVMAVKNDSLMGLFGWTWSWWFQKKQREVTPFLPSGVYLVDMVVGCPPTEMEVGALPEAVTKAVMGKIPNFKPSKIEESRRTGGTYYEIEGADGSNKMDVEIKADGSGMKSEKMGSGS